MQERCRTLTVSSSVSYLNLFRHRLQKLTEFVHGCIQAVFDVNENDLIASEAELQSLLEV